MIVTDKKPKTPREALSFESFEDRKRQLEQQEREEEKARERDKLENRKSPFDSFYQVNKVNSHYLRSCIKDCPGALDLLLFLFEHMDHYNAVIVSHRVLADVLGVSTRTIVRYITYLRDHGFISVAKSGTANVYICNKDLVWNSWGSNVKYCEFPANVVLSSDEQDDGVVKVRAKRKRIIEEVADNEDK